MKLRKVPGRDDITEIFDILREKWVKLTPEEAVRQHFVRWLITERDYPRFRMANEVSLSLNGMSRRCDTLIFDPSGVHPVAVVEYKAPTVRITAKVFAQAARYNTVFSTPVLIVSNGCVTCCAVVSEPNHPVFQKDIPDYTTLCSIASAKNE